MEDNIYERCQKFLFENSQNIYKEGYFNGAKDTLNLLEKEGWINLEVVEMIIKMFENGETDQLND